MPSLDVSLDGLRLDKKKIRALLLVVVLLSSVPVIVHGISSVGDETSGNREMVHDPDAIRSTSNLTVVTKHSWDDGRGAIAAIDHSGSIVYQNSTYPRYFDVDPVRDEKYSVIYVAERDLDPDACGISSSSELTCVEQVIEKLNVSTDTVDRVYTHTVLTSQNPDSWHDVDRVGPDRYLVADIFKHRAFIVNTTTGLITWEWMAASDYDIDSGGANKNDWTHINDVELIRNNSTVMASLRNHDQIVFIDTDEGVLEEWTLGEDDDHSTLYEQHNPDYVPEADGGPAVIVADSENNRIVEYQRVDGTWKRSWVWSDREMEWPRDADRLPNGHTLVADTHSNRLIELDVDGEIVWEAEYPKPYEVERLGTGDESTGGESARKIGLVNKTAQSTVDSGNDASATSPLRYSLVRLVPNKIRHGVLWVLPAWVTFFDVILIGVSLLALLSLVICELYWTDRVRLRSPITFD